MARSIILLTGKAEWPFLRDVLKEQSETLRISWAPNKQELEYTCGGQDVSNSRLVAFCSSVIVRPEILSLFSGPCYNFHPGPPSYPGVHSASFAIYEGAKKFGATAHIMTEKIDGGPLVDVEWFDIPDGIKSEDLEVRAFNLLFMLFTRLAPALVDTAKDLPVIDTTWSSNVRTQMDFTKLSKLTKSMSAEERQLRERAFGSR